MPNRSSQLPGVLALVLGMAVGSTALAQDQNQDKAPTKLTPAQRIKDPLAATPKEFDGVGLTEKLGERVPLDLRFRNERGDMVTLGQLMEGNLPIVLTLNYSDCPMLCDLMLSGLTKTLLDIPETKGVPNLAPGRQFRIITVSLNPNEKHERAARTKAGYVARFPEELQADVARGWHFLTGEADQIKALADSVGFRYRHRVKENDYLHSSVIMMLSADGMVTRYLKGIAYSPEVFTESVFSAGMSSPQASIGFLYSCFHYDSKANNYSNFGRQVMAYVGAAFAFLLLAAIGTRHVFRSRKSRIGV